MEALDITFGRAAKIWWAWTWRSMLIGVVLGIAIGFVIGIFSATVGLRHASVVKVVCGIIVFIIVGIWIVTRILKKYFAGFRILLIRD
jgi:uncharacterized protein YneF (UPF0154 family)